MTETICLTMPAALLARPASPRAGGRRPDDRPARVAAWIATAETRLRKIEAEARARAGARSRARASNEAIVARARALMAEAGGSLNAIEAVDQANAEAAAGKRAALASALETVKAESGKLDGGIVATMEAQLLELARKAIAAARRKLEAGLPLDAGEGALDAREALIAVDELRDGNPHRAKRLLQARVAPPKS